MPDPAKADRTEVFYLTSAPSARQFEVVRQALKPDVQAVTYGMAEASFKFHTLLQRGLLADAGTRVTAVVGRMVTPVFHSGSWWPAVTEEPAPGLTVKHLAFPNRRGLKQAWLAGSFAAQALRWRVRTRGAGHRVLIADGAYITALPLVLSVLSGGGIAKLAIFADLYSFMAPVEDAGGRRLGRLRGTLRRLAARTYARLDGFVVLTDHMNDVLNPARKPHVVVEGLVDSTTAALDNSLEDKSERPRFLYAGALRREYGVADLVDGFRALARPDVELHVYGGGDYADEVAAAAAKDDRITFHGMAPLDEVVAQEARAWVLVNPRPASAEFTKYSFPSKTMEYLSSGTAVLTTRLPGMPADYYPHVLTIDADGAPAITAALERTLGVPLADLHRLGADAKDFVLQRKNERAQAARILELARTCRR